VAMVGITTIVALLFWVGAVVLGFSFDLIRAVCWTAWTIVLLVLQVAVAEPLKVLLLALYWAKARKNVPK